MSSQNFNYLWAELVIEELVRCGVTRFCISPGSRNSPLVVAAAANPNAETIVHFDERGSAFYAVGYAKSTGVPAALICTSGTAVANYLPAVVEASMSTVPMIVVTADRPAELRNTGANQTIDQVGIYGNYVRWSFDLPAPSGNMSPEFVLTTVDELVYRAKRQPSGPVHLNCQYAEPLEPEAGNSVSNEYVKNLSRWYNSTSPFTKYVSPDPDPQESALSAFRELVCNSKRGMIVAGKLDSYEDLQPVIDLAEAIGMPLLADISSGLRFGNRDRQNLICHYDLFLRSSQFIEQIKPDLIIHVGGAVTSKLLNSYIQTADADYVLVNRTPFRQDPGHRVSIRIEADPGQFCRAALAEVDQSESEILSIFKDIENVCRVTLDENPLSDSFGNELTIVRQLTGMLPDDSGLFLGNSMPVRGSDSCGACCSKVVRVCVNRGASGIDGNLATAAGFASGLGKRTIMLIGDLGFLHDLNSLRLIKTSLVPITVVLINNDGGGIFSFLPISKNREHFEEFFGTPHGIDLEHAATLFGLDYASPKTPNEFERTFRKAISQDSSSLIEIRTDRERNIREHKRIWEDISEAVNSRLMSGRAR